jgi:hypothetical protein
VLEAGSGRSFRVGPGRWNGAGVAVGCSSGGVGEAEGGQGTE